MSESAARKLLYQRSERVCERCGMRRASNAHHRRSAGRVWTPENLLDLDGSGTTGCHGWVEHNPTTSAQFGWSVESWADATTVPYRRFDGWWVLLDDRGAAHTTKAPPDNDARNVAVRRSIPSN